MSLADGLAARYAARPVARLLVVATAFLAIFVASWPFVLSFDLWVLKDRGSFMHLDYLLDQPLELGVNVGYSYGLLPVLIQHVVFAVFGRGHWPMIGCNIAVLLLKAGIWARVVERLPDPKIGLIAVLALSPILLSIDPIFPYALVETSIPLALLLVLEKRADLALAVAALGWLSVPSVPLLLTGLLFLFLVAEWWLEGERSLGVLARRLMPGAVVLAVTAAILMAVFGARSLVSTALPIAGAAFYRATNYGFRSLFEFLYPTGHRLTTYYLCNRAGWWIASTLALFGLTVWAAWGIVRGRSLEPRRATVVLCGVVHGIFVFRAYGSPGQHLIYDPVLALGVLVGLSCLPLGALGRPLLAGFLLLAVLGHWGQFRGTVLAWQNTQRGSNTAGLYASPAYAREWDDVLARSAAQHLLLLSYGTGAHHYFPTVETTDSWFLLPGLMLRADEARLIAKVRQAEVIVQDLTGPTAFVDNDADVQKELASRCLTKSTASFRIWTRRPCGEGRASVDSQQQYDDVLARPTP